VVVKYWQNNFVTNLEGNIMVNLILVPHKANDLNGEFDGFPDTPYSLIFSSSQFCAIQYQVSTQCMV